MADQDPSENPAIERQTIVPPSLLAELEKDPDAMLPHYRKMLAIQAVKMHQILKSPAVPLGQRIQVAEFFAKIAGADKKAQQNALAQMATLPSIQIVFSNATPKTLTAAPVEVVDVKATEPEQPTDIEDKSAENDTDVGPDQV